MKRKIFLAYIRSGNLIKGRHSFVLVIVVNICILFSGYFLSVRLPGFEITRVRATEVQKDILSDFISLLGIGLAVLAVLLAIIQFAYKRINIIRIVITHTFFAPMVYFGLFNTIVCTINYLYHSDSKLVSDKIFIYITIAETYSFAIFCIFVAYVFFRTFNFSSFSKITDLYLNNVRRIVKLEKKLGVTDDDAELLVTAASELKSEMDESVKDSKLAVISKIFDLYLFVLAENPQSNLFRGFKISFQNWILESNRNRDINTLLKLIISWRELFKRALSSGDNNKIDVLRYFARDLYEIIPGIEGQVARKLVIDYFPLRLKELGMLQVMQIRNKNGALIPLAEAYASIMPILQEFNELIKSTIEAHDIAGLQECLQQLKHLIGDHQISHKTEELNLQIKFAKMNVPGYQLPTDDELDRLLLHKELTDRKFAVVFGNISWIYYQILKRNADESQYHQEIELLLQYLPKDNHILLQSAAKFIHSDEDFLQWEKWITAEEMPLSGEVYFITHNQLFLSIGLIVLLSRYALTAANVTTFDIEEAQVIAKIKHWIEDAIKQFGNLADLWSQIMQVPVNEVQNKIQAIQAHFKEFDRIKENVELIELSKAPLSISKIEEFKKTIFEQWNTTNTLTRVFEYLNAAQHNPKQKLMTVGMMRIHFEKAKFLFTEVQHRKIHGIEWGHEVNSAVTTLFLQRLKEADIHQIRTNSYLDIFENLPKEITQENSGYIVVFHSFVSTYTILRDLENTGNFKSADQFTGEQFPFDFTGVYRSNILLIPIRTQSLRDRIIITRIPEGIKLFRKEQEDWVEKLLQVDVIEVDAENAERLAAKKYPDKQITPELLIEMLSGVFIEINETLDFAIIEKKQVAMYILNKNTEPDLE